MLHVVGARAALPEPLLDDDSLFASDDFLETSLVPAGCALGQRGRTEYPE